MRFARSGLETFAVQALTIAGADADEAREKAGILLWCDAIGRDTQGLWRLPMLVRRLQKGLHNSPCRLEYEHVAPSVSRLDGDSGLGYIVASRAMERAVSLAKSQGVGCVAVRNSSHLGAAAYYVKLAADAGMIGMCFSNSVPKVIPPGGSEPVFGTNPVAIGCPRQSGDHLLLDMASAVSAGSTVTKALQKREPLGDAAVIKQGGDSADMTSEAGRVGLPSMAGGKGFGLGLAIEILAAVVTGAGITRELRSMHHDFSGPANNGHLMVALDIEPLMDMPAYYQRLEGLLGQVESAGGRMPGQVRWDHYRESKSAGVVIDKTLQSLLEQLARDLSIDVPWQVNTEDRPE